MKTTPQAICNPENLLANLGCTDRQLGSEAIETIVHFAFKAPSVIIPGLANILVHGNPIQRIRASKAVRQISPSYISDMMGALLEALNDNEPKVRENICYAFGDSGQIAVHAAIPLTNLLSDHCQDVKLAAIDVLVDMEWGNWRAAPALLKHLASTTDSVFRKKILKAIKNCGNAAFAILPDLITLLKDTDKGKVIDAIKLIGEFGWAAGVAVPDLIECISHQDLEVKEAACRSLAKVGPAAFAATDLLMDLVKHSNEKISLIATESLDEILEYESYYKAEDEVN